MPDRIESRRQRVLIVEDSRVEALVVQRELKKLGYEVVGIAASGMEALEQSSVNSPDLILMDIVLPGKLDGISTAKRLRKAFGAAIIFLTAHTEMKLIERAIRVESFGFIPIFNEKNHWNRKKNFGKKPVTIFANWALTSAPGLFKVRIFFR